MLKTGVISVYYQYKSTFSVQYDLMLALRSQIFEYLGESVNRHALELLKPAPSEKTKETLFLRKHQAVI